ncbi:MAG: VIT1/CCC1 transporter family protein [Patescibacteria group bacterium]|jgi:VIT1/CCC1 family predicted Fe2+/Mn2+ transporter
MASVFKNLSREIREVVFGIEDSLVSTMGVITGVAGGTASKGTVIMTGLVVVVVEAVSMAAGSYLSSKSKRQADERGLRELRDFVAKEPARAEALLTQAYQHRGFQPAEIQILLRRVVPNQKLLAEELNAHKLHVDLPIHEAPTENAWYMGISYILAGIIPILPYAFFSVRTAIVVSVVCTAIALFLLGVGKAKLVQQRPLRSGLEMFIISLCAAAIGFIIGKVAGAALGV